MGTGTVGWRRLGQIGPSDSQSGGNHREVGVVCRLRLTASLELQVAIWIPYVKVLEVKLSQRKQSLDMAGESDNISNIWIHLYLDLVYIGLESYMS